MQDSEPTINPTVAADDYRIHGIRPNTKHSEICCYGSTGAPRGASWRASQIVWIADLSAET
jgi:hypothetical protein